MSLLIHVSILFSVDHAIPEFHKKILFQQRQILQKKDDRVELQFVESPPQRLIPHKPRATHKISNRDALNQDLLKKRSDRDNPPAVKNPGRTDQLAQRQGDGSRLSSFAPLRGSSEDRSNKNTTSSSSKRAERARREATDGQDKIITQEVARLKSGGAQLYGMVSFEATGSGMGVYMKNLKEKIWMSWFPYLAFHYPTDFRGSRSVVSFTLGSKGELKKIKIVESEGSPAFAAYCLEAVKKAGGFGELPKEILALLGKDELEIKFGFNYR